MVCEADSTPTQTYLSWDTLSAAASLLAESMVLKHPKHNILTITKGGLISAFLLSCHLPWKPQVVSLSLENLEDTKHKILLPKKPFVLVDDILDTAQTMLKFEARFEEHGIELFHFPTYFLVDKPGPHRQPFYFENTEFGLRVEGGHWVVFPWDFLESDQF